MSSFQGNEEDKMPELVIDLLRDGRGQLREAIKISFSLDTAVGSGLPQLGPNSLNALLTIVHLDIFGTYIQTSVYSVNLSVRYFIPV